MDLFIYRIFNALGDSIILSTYFKAFDIKRVYYNRAELNLLQTIMKMYDVHDVEFIPQQERIQTTMIDIVRQLHKKRVNVLQLEKTGDQLIVTAQLESHHESAKDRSIQLYEALPHIKYNMSIKQVGREKTVEKLYEIMNNSVQHISIDSGTAWFAASLRLDTTVISKNGYYFPSSYHYMRYLDSQPTVDVYQQHGKGVKIPNEIEFNQAIAENKPHSVISYQSYLEQVK